MLLAGMGCSAVMSARRKGRPIIRLAHEPANTKRTTRRLRFSRSARAPARGRLHRRRDPIFLGEVTQFARTPKSTDMDWIWGFLIAFMGVMILHQPEFSVQSIVIGSRPFSYFGMASLKFLVGVLNSSAILAICSAVFRCRPSRGMVWGAVVTQILLLEIEWGFSLGSMHIGELGIRFAEEIGTITSGAVLLACLRLWPPASRAQS